MDPAITVYFSFAIAYVPGYKTGYLPGYKIDEKFINTLRKEPNNHRT